MLGGRPAQVCGTAWFCAPLVACRMRNKRSICLQYGHMSLQVCLSIGRYIHTPLSHPSDHRCKLTPNMPRTFCSSRWLKCQHIGSVHSPQCQTGLFSTDLPCAGAVVVPRSRFAPVKTCNDLFMLRSDVYKIDHDATIVATIPVVPLIKLDDAHYKLVDQMEGLVQQPPSLREATSLTVKGAAKFDAGEHGGQACVWWSR